MTTPLITTADGAKMGKTAQGAVWLNAELLSPYDYWQFWRNTQDADVGRFLRLFTDLPLDEIARLESLAGAEINEAKIVLATEATAMLHGREAASAAKQTAQADVRGRRRGRGPADASVGDGMNIAHALDRAGLHAVEQGSEAQDRRGRGAARRRGGERSRA